LLVGLLTLDSFAQSKITGEIIDETDNTKLTNATVMLLQAKDSILVDFTRVNQDGKFSINNPDTANYLLLVSYPKFGDYYQEIEKGSGNKQLGKISLQSTANLIEEVLITGKIPVVIKGDTVEYDASSFTTEKNAKVEDLLKVLPGISVDATGKITAQGKTVEKVLVDGEEFFGDDPTLVTRNIRSDMVDKVQVYEKKSEESERTGVDDGQRVQTIDLKLKEDAKKGVFGKLEGAGGMDDNSGYYLGKAAVNKFNGSQKIGAYVLGSNDGNVSLNWEEEEKFNMSTMESGMTDDGGYYFYSNRDEFSYWNGKGQPRAISTGISFMDAWKEKKHKLNLSYKYAKIQNDILESTINQTPSENGLISNNTNN
ncbi:MAG: carboxypeptidase-like regulatory domain-containing protein, partial [Sphingobacterium sp.]